MAYSDAILRRQCGVSSDWYHNDRIGFWKNVYGYDMSHLQPQAMSDADVAVVPPSHIATDMTTFHVSELMPKLALY